MEIPYVMSSDSDTFKANPLTFKLGEIASVWVLSLS